MTDTEILNCTSPCSQEGCTGHRGKFPTCLTEALWEISMYAGESTGSTEAYGHFTLIHIDTEEIHVMGSDLGVPEDQQGPRVTIPAGWYMVESYESGAVIHTEHESELHATEAWTAYDEEYSAWLEINEPEIAPNAGSAD